MFGLKQSVCCVQNPTSGLLSAIVIFSVIESSEVRVQLPEFFFFYVGNQHLDVKYMFTLGSEGDVTPPKKKTKKKIRIGESKNPGKTPS